MPSTTTTKFAFDCAVYTIMDEYYSLYFQITENTVGDILESDQSIGNT